MSKLGNDLKGLGEILKKVTGIESLSDGEVSTPEIQFTCTCGFSQSYDCSELKPFEVSSRIEAHINACEAAQKAFR